jgi:hypothetical protein
MYSISIDKSIVTGSTFINSNKLLPHEEVMKDRLETLINYLITLSPYIIMPSILVCNKTLMIIDGHHRFYALQKMGISQMPVTLLNYESNCIFTDPDNSVDKMVLIEAAKSDKMLPPKTSAHHILDNENDLHPIILLSVLFNITNPK